MKPGLHSILISDGSSLDDATRSSECWIDHLPNLNDYQIAIVQDYLSSECRIHLPSPNPSDRMFGFRAVSSLTLHDANCMRTRLQKKAVDDSLADILRLYGYAGEGGNEWVHYFSRQCLHFTADDYRIALLVTTDDFVDDTWSLSP